MELPKSTLAVIDLLKKTRGRDKVFRLFQYTFRCLTDIIQRDPLQRRFRDKASQNNMVENFRNVANTMASTRKLFRFLKHYDIFLRISKMCNILAGKIQEPERKPDIYYLLKIGSDISLFLYYLTDHLLYFYFLEVMPKTKIYDSISWSSDFLWLIESIIDTIMAAVDAWYHAKGNRMAAMRKSLLEIILYIVDSLVNLSDSLWIYHDSFPQIPHLPVRNRELDHRIIYAARLLVTNWHFFKVDVGLGLQESD